MPIAISFYCSIIVSAWRIVCSVSLNSKSREFCAHRHDVDSNVGPIYIVCLFAYFVCLFVLVTWSMKVREKGRERAKSGTRLMWPKVVFVVDVCVHDHCQLTAMITDSLSDCAWGIALSFPFSCSSCTVSGRTSSTLTILSVSTARALSYLTS